MLSSAQVNDQLYEVVVSSDELRGDQKIRILVPRDYTTNGSNRRYPVLYLLHGAYGVVLQIGQQLVQLKPSVVMYH